MNDEIKIEPADPRPTDPAHRPVERAHLSPHPWWSRLLYALYGLASVAAAIAALLYDETQLAVPAAGIALVLFWKALQRAR